MNYKLWNKQIIKHKEDGTKSKKLVQIFFNTLKKSRKFLILKGSELDPFKISI